jgi:sulfite reductase (NADPH) flavoprotein alpha-component
MCGKNRDGTEEGRVYARVEDLGRYDPGDLFTESTVLLAISTWGEGEPPDNGIAFYNYVKDLEEMSLRNLRFAVFALGDTSYENFCQCGRDLDRMFEERGASRLLERIDSDVDFGEALAGWHESIAGAIQVL